MQRKVFRVEQMFKDAGACEPRKAPDNARPTLSEQPSDHKLKDELTHIQDVIARNKRDLVALIGNGKERKMAHAAGELGAAVEGMEKATDTILKSAEVVDDSARALVATLKDDYKRGLAQDIADHAVKIYEACNFQDLSGQRIGNVIRVLNSVEEQVAAMLERFDAVSTKAPAPPAAAPGRSLLNGPRLDGADGHINQRDIDKMFG
ncbi:MAG: protein phosphatase CheZ [Pseudolabrys sp.]